MEDSPRPSEGGEEQGEGELDSPGQAYLGSASSSTSSMITTRTTPTHATGNEKEAGKGVSHSPRKGAPTGLLDTQSLRELLDTVIRGTQGWTVDRLIHIHTRLYQVLHRYRYHAEKEAALTVRTVCSRCFSLRADVSVFSVCSCVLVCFFVFVYFLALVCTGVVCRCGTGRTVSLDVRESKRERGGEAETDSEIDYTH